MSKINFDTENPEVEITRAIGKKSEGKITLNTEGGSIEIDLGFASIGATTDYGGAVSVGLLGQEITWGREGGTIHIGIGGFAVDVEAKDCIVTEIKSIFGHIVAQRSYPDPGCELPEEEPPIPPYDPIQGVKMEDGNEFVYCVVEYSYYRLDRIFDSLGNLRSIQTSASKHEINVFDIPEIVLAPGTIPFGVSDSFETTRTQVAVRGELSPGVTSKGVVQKVTSGSIPKNSPIINNYASVRYTPASGYQWQAPSYTVNDNPSGDNGLTGGATQIPQVIYGTKTNCNAWVRNGNQKSSSYWGEINNTCIIKKIIPLGKQNRRLPPLLPTGNKPPMQNCCEEVLDMLEDIKEAFAVDRLLKDEFPVSNTFMAPGCDPASVTKAKNYYEIFQCVMRMMAHGMIFEPRVSIKDADAAKAGDQSLETKYVNATGWASAVAEALLEVKDDGNVSTNMDIRNGFAVTQTMVGVSDAIYRLNAILDSIGVELIPVIQTVDTPYNLQIQIGKGFGEGNERQIDLNQDEATEKLLPAMLQVKTNKIKTVDTHPRSRSIMDVLESIEANLPSNNNA